MSNMIKGYMVAIEHNLNEEHAKAVANAIRLLHGVIDVKPIETASEDFLIRSRVGWEFEEKIYGLLRGMRESR